MNLPVETIHSRDYEVRIYKEGYKDGRHAAAEIATKADTEIANLREALTQVLGQWVADTAGETGDNELYNRAERLVNG